MASAHRVVIVHDYLTQRGGAERAVLAMTRTFPDARVVTSLYNPETTFPEFADVRVETSPLQHVAPFRRHHRLAFPLYPAIFGRIHIDADVVICSTSGWAHGVTTSGRKLLYVHNPARWLYQGEEYLQHSTRLTCGAMATVRNRLRAWDRRSATRADAVLANSKTVQDRIRSSWGLESEIVHPPISIRTSGEQDPVHGVMPGYLLVVARLLAYKNVDAVVDAMALLPNDDLVVVGDGPELSRLIARAPRNVSFLSDVSESELAWLYANSTALIAAATEDFGLAPLEAMAFGRPVAALARAGFLETVVDGHTGVFFDAPEPGQIARAVTELTRRSWESGEIAAHAASFSEDAFSAKLRSVVDGLRERVLV